MEAFSKRYRNEFSTGLYDYNARQFSPTIGRFISPDSIVPDPNRSQDWNRYMYVRGNPVGYTDPTGNTPASPFSDTKLEQENPRRKRGILDTPAPLKSDKRIITPAPAASEKRIVTPASQRDSGRHINIQTGPTPTGIHINIPSGGLQNPSEIFTSRGNPNPNINPPGHRPGPNVQLPEGGRVQDWPPKDDPTQRPPEWPTEIRPPQKGDSPSIYVFWILMHLAQIAAGEGNTNGTYAPPGVDSVVDGGQ
jgi:RHS repeat-associated protein